MEEFELYRKKEECCGCAACYSICPQLAIVMKQDTEGFEYPVILEEKCIKCFLCVSVCPYKIAKEKDETGDL